MDTVIDPVSPPQSSLMPMPKAYASLNVLEALMETTKLMLVWLFALHNNMASLQLISVLCVPLLVLFVWILPTVMLVSLQPHLRSTTCAIPTVIPVLDILTMAHAITPVPMEPIWHTPMLYAQHVLQFVSPARERPTFARPAKPVTTSTRLVLRYVLLVILETPQPYNVWTALQWLAQCAHRL